MKVFVKIISAVMAFIMAMASGSTPSEKKCDPKFTGSFIQSWLVAEWDQKRCDKEAQNMKDAGMEFVIIQDLANKPPRKPWEVAYKTEAPILKDSVFVGDALEPMLKACQKSGVKVFVGLSLFDEFWTRGSMTKQYFEMCEVAAQMVEDIYARYYEQYKDTICGWYFTPEINNVVTCQVNITGMAKGLNTIIDSINKTTPDLPILLSPFYAEYLSSGPVITLANLVRFFDTVNFRDGDIFAIQDAVGAKWVKEENLEMTWKLYAEAIKAANADVKLWANCENFSLAFSDTLIDGIFTRPVTENTETITETLDRFVWQMDMATKYAENIITFSYSHYYSPDYVNSCFIDTYLDYVNNDFTLEREAPKAVEDFYAAEENGGISLTWKAAEDNIGIALYKIYRNGELVKRIEMSKGNEALKYFLAGAKAKDKIEILAVDGAGNLSAKTEARFLKLAS